MPLTHDAPAPVLANISGTDRKFPIRRIFCVGRNYAAHAREMGKDPDRDPPFFFTKWAETYVPSDSEVAYPPETDNYHYEVELVVALGKGGVNIKEADAYSHIYGYAAGLDMTRRDLQLVARDKGRPWDTGKNFEQAAPIGDITPAADIGKLEKGRISLEVSGEIRQDADLSELIWSVDEIISILSTFYRLSPGDLIMTGTPAGVGPVKPGDNLVGRIEGLSDIGISIVAKS